MNWVLLPGRKKTRFLLMKCIEAWFMNHQEVRKNVHDNRFAQGFDLTDYAHRQLCASIEHVSKSVCAPTNHPAVYIVETIPAQAQYTVNINSHTCTCRRWDDLQVPCIHACKAILARGENLVQYTGLQWTFPASDEAGPTH